MLLAVSSCAHLSPAWAAQNAAKVLLCKHSASMLQLASRLLQQQPEEQLTAAAAAAVAGTASSKATGARAQAAAGLANLLDALLVSVNTCAGDKAACAALQGSAAAQSIRSFEAALYAVLDGRAACLAWLPAIERQRVQHMCSKAATAFKLLFATARPPAPPPPPQLLPQPQPAPAARVIGSTGGGTQHANSGDGRRASYAAAAASDAGQRPPPGLVPAGPEPAGGELAGRPTYAAMARAGQAATEQQRRSTPTHPQIEQRKSFVGRAIDLVRNFLSID